MHIIKHFITITKHRHKVMRYCFQSGLYKQGILHDLSKYGLLEFKNGAKFYSGKYSPHYNERLKKDIVKHGCIIKGEISIMQSIGLILI